ncbi:uncharacterized protein [Argopecten irradians]|uniref:uncharacterized protein n=1 Tax=Argopecten irradians TaxID=31199 RepID=UPI00371351F0
MSIIGRNWTFDFPGWLPWCTICIMPDHAGRVEQASKEDFQRVSSIAVGSSTFGFMSDKILDRGDIDEDTASFLRPENAQAGKFYLLPKIHKPGNPGRPIINSIGHPTEKISKFIDFHLRPIVENLPSYLKDTTDYLNKTPCHDLPDGTLLVKIGCCLYTNIPHADGIAACRAAWDRRVSNHPSTQILVDLLKLVLTLNNFKFNDDKYLQISGTAMGTKMAPSYANVFMGHLESAILTSAPIQPFSCLRFIDDIEIKWTSNRQSLR